jgi:hypothetical protein
MTKTAGSIADGHAGLLLLHVVALTSMHLVILSIMNTHAFTSRNPAA